MYVPEKLALRIGKLGKKSIKSGYYFYTGSALGKGSTSLPQRLFRHLRHEKKRFWHVDFLLDGKSALIKAIFIVDSKEKLECKVNLFLNNTFNTHVLIPGFGSTDCPQKCKSHILYVGDVIDEKEVFQILEEKFNKNVILITCARS